MGRKPKILDQFGRPVKRANLTKEIAAPTVGGVRSPIAGYPADGLNPLRLAQILREADAGDPVRYLELAEIVEERDLHYLGVLGTRRRAVSQVPITVEPASDAKADVELADMVRDWVDRDELEAELFNMLDAIGKGYSFTEVIWEYSEGQYQPNQLELRDPRHFRFAYHDLKTPMRLDEDGQWVPLEFAKFIHANMPAKSGLPIRSGIARAVLWGWMFKAFTQRDWAIFTQTYGQPLRVGKFGPGASEADRDTLFRAVANIAGDCAAIIPESMQIDFVETGNLSASVDHYERRSDWLDRQVSKAVLGQTSTTDAEVGGLGSGKEHREVQEVIERADCKAIQAIINRDLIVPWVQLERGPQKRYPKIRIARPEEEDLAQFVSAISPLVDRGLRVSTASIYDKFGLPEAGEEDEILRPMAKSGPKSAPDDKPGGGEDASFAVKGALKGSVGAKAKSTTEDAEMQSEGVSGASQALDPQPRAPASDDDAPKPAPAELLGGQLEREASPGMEAMLDQVEAMLEAAGSLEEFREMLSAAFPKVDASKLSAAIAKGLIAADLAGRAALEEESRG